VRVKADLGGWQRDEVILVGVDDVVCRRRDRSRSAAEFVGDRIE
jgi:hypothetical protein